MYVRTYVHMDEPHIRLYCTDTAITLQSLLCVLGVDSVNMTIVQVCMCMCCEDTAKGTRKRASLSAAFNQLWTTLQEHDIDTNTHSKGYIHTYIGSKRTLPQPLSQMFPQLKQRQAQWHIWHAQTHSLMHLAHYASLFNRTKSPPSTHVDSSTQTVIMRVCPEL